REQKRDAVHRGSRSIHARTLPRPRVTNAARMVARHNPGPAAGWRFYRLGSIFCGNACAGPPLRPQLARTLMGIGALGYRGVRARDVGDGASYGETFLGLQRIDKSRSSLAFRMDDRKQRLVVDADGGQGIGFFGWEVADAAALNAVAARIDAAGIGVA